MKYVLSAPCKKIVKADDIISFTDQTLAKVRTDKPRTACNKNSHNKRSLLKLIMLLAANHIISQIEHIHARLQKAVNGVARSADDRLILIKRCVQNHRNSCQSVKV